MHASRRKLTSSRRCRRSVFHRGPRRFRYPRLLLQGCDRECDHFREGPLFSNNRPSQSSPPHVPCAPWHGAPEDIVFRSRLEYFGHFFWTDCSNLSSTGARSAEHCSGQHQLDNMLTATVAAIGWLNIITCINFAGHGRADTVWIVQLEHEHHLGKGASIGSGAATESIDVCGCATLLSKSEA